MVLLVENKIEKTKKEKEEIDLVNIGNLLGCSSGIKSPFGLFW